MEQRDERGDETLRERPVEVAEQHGPEAPPDSLELLVPKRRLWPVFAVLAAIVLGGAFFAWRSLTRPDPLRILIAVDVNGYWWEGSADAAKLADQLAERLTALGFEPVKAGDAEALKIIEKAKTPEEAAKKLKAAFVIEAHVTPEMIEHPAWGQYFEARVDAPVTLVHLPTGQRTEGRMRGYTGAPEKQRAIDLLVDSMTDHAFDSVIGVLIEHPTVKELFDGSNVRLVEKLDPARKFAKERAEKLRIAKEAYDFRAKEREQEDAGRVTYHSGPMAADLLVGTGPEGVLVRTADVTPFYSYNKRDLVLGEELEMVSWRALDGAAKAPLWKGYHVFSYPSAAAGGAPVALVEDLFGGAKTLTVLGGDGKPRRLKVDKKRRFVDPRIAPGGSYSAFYDRACATCAASLTALDLSSGAEVFRFASDRSVRGYAFVGPSKLALVVRPAAPLVSAFGDDGAKRDDKKGDAKGGDDQKTDAGGEALPEPYHVAVVDVATLGVAAEGMDHTEAVLRSLAAALPGESWSELSASRDGKKLAFVYRGAEAGAGVGVLDVATGKVTRHKVGYASWPSFSPDASKLVYELATRGGNEIALLDLATGKDTQLTNNKSDERLPMFSNDGARVFFEARDKDPMFPRSRMISRIASVKVEP